MGGARVGGVVGGMVGGAARLARVAMLARAERTERTGPTLVGERAGVGEAGVSRISTSTDISMVASGSIQSIKVICCLIVCARRRRRRRNWVGDGEG